MFEHHISQEGFEWLHAWCLAHWPEAAQDPQFLPGLIVVIELVIVIICELARLDDDTFAVAVPADGQCADPELLDDRLRKDGRCCVGRSFADINAALAQCQ